MPPVKLYHLTRYVWSLTHVRLKNPTRYSGQRFRQPLVDLDSVVGRSGTRVKEQCMFGRG